MTDDNKSEGDIWNALRSASQIKRSQNRDNSADLLRAAKIPFESNNMGAHLIVRPALSLEVADFWPGTGKWIVRGSTMKHMRGAKNLIDWCKTRAVVKSPAPKR